MSSLSARFGWLLVAGALAWLAFELTRPAPQLPAMGQDEAPPVALAMPEPAPEPPLLAEFKASLERPLFNAERRPVRALGGDDQGASVAADRADAPTVRLSAVIVDADGASALLAGPDDVQARRVPLGGSIAGWRVEQIRDDGVVLRSGERRAELALRTYAPPPPALRLRARQALQGRQPATVAPRRPTPPPRGLESDEPVQPDDPDFLPPEGTPAED